MPARVISEEELLLTLGTWDPAGSHGHRQGNSRKRCRGVIPYDGKPHDSVRRAVHGSLHEG